MSLIQSLSGRLAAFAICLAFSLCFSAERAEAGYFVCNSAPLTMQMAVGIPEGRNLRVAGWYNVSSGECREIVQGTLGPGTYYVYGKTFEYQDNGIPSIDEWLGAEQYRYTLCVSDAAFNLLNALNCKPNGYYGVPFSAFCVTQSGSVADLVKHPRGSVNVNLPPLRPGEHNAVSHLGRCSDDPVASRKWVKYFGAIALETRDLNWAAKVARTQYDADAAALSACNGGCFIDYRFSAPKCIAVAYRAPTQSTPGKLSWGTGAYPREAKYRALASCSGCSIEGGNCARDSN